MREALAIALVLVALLGIVIACEPKPVVLQPWGVATGRLTVSDAGRD